jgi:hypothetical protein
MRDTGGIPTLEACGDTARDAFYADAQAPLIQLCRFCEMHMYGTWALLPLLHLECDPKPLA